MCTNYLFSTLGVHVANLGLARFTAADTHLLLSIRVDNLACVCIYVCVCVCVFVCVCVRARARTRILCQILSYI